MLRPQLVLIVILIGLSACKGGAGNALPPVGPRHALSVTPGLPGQWTSGSGFQLSSITVSFGKAPAVGDLLVVAFWNNGQSSGAGNTYTPPSGWTLVDQNLTGWYTGYQSFSHVVASGETNAYVFIPAAAQRTTAWIGADIGGAGTIDGAANAYINNSTTWTSPSVSASASSDLALVFQFPFGASTWTNPAGWTLGTGPTAQWHGESLYQQLSSTGAVSETSTYATASYGYSAIVLISPSGTQSSPTPSPAVSPSPSPSPSPPPSPAPPPSGNAPSLVQSSSGNAFAPASITVQFTRTPITGDRLVVAFWNNGQSSGAANTYTPPAGWTVVDQNLNYYATYQSFSHVVASGETNKYVFSTAAAQRSHVWIGAEIAGANGVDGAKNTYISTSTIWSTPSLTPSQTNDLALAFQLPFYAYTWANPVAWNVGTGPTAQWHGESLYQQLASTAADSETSTYSAATYGFSALILLAAAPSATTPTPSPTSTPVSTPTPNPTATPTSFDWSTFGYDLQRSGYNANERRLGAGSFATLHAMWASTAYVGSGMQSEPVVATDVNVLGVSRNLLYGGAGSGAFYAVDADTGAVVWQKQLNTTTYTCSGSTSIWGIEGTAALDRARNRVYVPDGNNTIHALDLATGAEAAGWPISIAPVTHDDFIHTAVNYNPANGLLYATTGSTCDISPWYGRVAAVNASTATLVNTFYPTQGTSGGGVWGWGGVSIDPATNNVFVAVGNADTAGGASESAYYAENVVELSADLSTVIASNFPPNMPVMTDSDFGATPLLFQPIGCPPLLAAVNKSGAFVLYNRTNISAGPMQEIVMASTGSEFRGVPAYDPITNYVYVALPDSQGIYLPGVGAFSLNTDCTLNPTPVWNGTFGATKDKRSPITIANGIVYVAGYNEKTVYAFDAASGAQLWSGALGGAGQIGPVVINGHLYVGDVGGTIHAWTP